MVVFCSHDDAAKQRSDLEDQQLDRNLSGLSLFITCVALFFVSI